MNVLFAINDPSDDQPMRSHRCAVIVGDDVNEHPLSGSDGFGPFVFKSEVFTSIKAGVLSEVVKPFPRAVESGGDVVTAMVSSAAIRLAGIGLRTP